MRQAWRVNLPTGLNASLVAVYVLPCLLSVVKPLRAFVNQP